MYKQKLIEKVLFHDLQSTNNNNNRPTSKPCNDKSGKERNTTRVDVQRQSAGLPDSIIFNTKRIG